MAAGPTTKSKIIAHLAKTAEVSKKTAAQMLEALSDLAYKEAKKGFTVPGLGKLVLVNRKARMGRNPLTGATIKIPAKKVVKFRVAKAAKDSILGAKKYPNPPPGLRPPSPRNGERVTKQTHFRPFISFNNRAYSAIGCIPIFARRSSTCDSSSIGNGTNSPFTSWNCVP